MTELPILERVRRRLAAGTSEPTPHTVAAALRAEHHVAGSGTVLALVDQLRSETRGAGLLDPLLATPGVTDVLVNGPDEVYLDRGAGSRSPPCGSPTRSPYADWPSGSPPRPDAGSTMRALGSTRGSATAPGSMRSWRRWPGRAR